MEKAGDGDSDGAGDGVKEGFMHMYAEAIKQVKRSISASSQSQSQSQLQIPVEEIAAAVFRFSGNSEQSVLYLLHSFSGASGSGSDPDPDPRIWPLGRQIQERDQLARSVARRVSRSDNARSIAGSASAAQPAGLAPLERLPQDLQTQIYLYLYPISHIHGFVRLGLISKSLHQSVYNGDVSSSERLEGVRGTKRFTSLWVNIDFAAVPHSFAQKLTDDQLCSLLTHCNARNITKCISLYGCSNITGAGLAPLHHSKVLQRLDIMGSDYESQYFYDTGTIDTLCTMVPAMLVDENEDKNGKASTIDDGKDAPSLMVVRFDKLAACSELDSCILRLKHEVNDQAKHKLREQQIRCDYCDKNMPGDSFFFRTESVAKQIANFKAEPGCQRCHKISCGKGTCPTIGQCDECKDILCERCAQHLHEEAKVLLDAAAENSQKFRTERGSAEHKRAEAEYVKVFEENPHGICAWYTQRCRVCHKERCNVCDDHGGSFCDGCDQLPECYICEECKNSNFAYSCHGCYSWFYDEHVVEGDAGGCCYNCHHFFCRDCLHVHRHHDEGCPDEQCACDPSFELEDCKSEGERFEAFLQFCDYKRFLRGHSRLGLIPAKFRWRFNENAREKQARKQAREEDERLMRQWEAHDEDDDDY